MKRDTDKQFDDLFKNSLAEPQHIVAHREEEWDALAQRLDGASGNKKIIALWWPISTAAVLLVVVGLWVLMPQATKQSQQKRQVAANKVAKPKDIAVEKQAPAPMTAPAAVTQPKPSQLVANNVAVSTRSAKTSASAKATGYNGTTSPVPLPQAGNVVSDQVVTDLQVATNTNQTVTATTVTEQPVIAANTPPANTVTVSGQATVITDSLAVDPAKNVAAVTAADATVKQPGSISKILSSIRPQYAMSFIGAPEINGLGAMLNVRSGVNLGMMFSASVNRIRVSTGAMYSVKEYASAYDPWGYMSVARGYSQAIANSRIIDIPLNVDYQLYSRSQNKFSVGAGLSSYIMLSQNYQYNYVDPDFAPTTMDIEGADRYFLSTLNLQATYTRQINSKFGLSFQPYFKLPLKQIGDSQSRLQTAGLAIGANWNLNTLRKK